VFNNNHLTLHHHHHQKMKFSTAFVLLSGAPAAMGFQSVGKKPKKYDAIFERDRGGGEVI
jgi:hypothetical protein